VFKHVIIVGRYS